MEDMEASSARGHQFEWTSKNPNNSSIQCLLCTLYVQQVAPLDVFARYELQECRDRPMPWPDYWPKPADHKMHNLGALWSCEVCHACIRVAAKKFPQKLLNPCKGMPRRRVGGFGLLMPTPGPSLLPDRPTPQARVRQNTPKAKAGASLKLGSLFKPSRADPSVCSQGNSSLCSLSCRSATHLPSSGEVGWALRSRGQPRPTMGKGKSKGKTKPRQSQHKGAKGKEKGKEKGKDKGQEQDLQKGKAQEKGKGKAPSRVRADPTEEAHFRRLRAHREAAGRTRTSRTTGARSRTRRCEPSKGLNKGQPRERRKEERGQGKNPSQNRRARVRRRRRKGHESRQPLQRPDRG